MKLRFFVLASVFLASTLVSCSSISETPDSPNYEALIYGEGCKPTRVAIRRYSGVSYTESSLKVEDIKTGEVFYFTGNVQTVIVTPQEVATYKEEGTLNAAQASLIDSLQKRGVIPSCELKVK